MRRIKLSGKKGEGKHALVDDDMYDYLSQWRWNLSHGYAVCCKKVATVEGRPIYKTFLMHRIVTNAPDGVKVDHRDVNRLNNTRTNLRLCNDVDNSRNRSRQSNNLSGCIGVFWKADRQRWGAIAWSQGRSINIGTFRDKHEAAYVRDQFALQLYGEYARLNTPLE